MPELSQKNQEMLNNIIKNPKTEIITSHPKEITRTATAKFLSGLAVMGVVSLTAFTSQDANAAAPTKSEAVQSKIITAKDALFLEDMNMLGLEQHTGSGKVVEIIKTPDDKGKQAEVAASADNLENDIKSLNGRRDAAKLHKLESSLNKSGYSIAYETPDKIEDMQSTGLTWGAVGGFFADTAKLGAKVVGVTAGLAQGGVGLAFDATKGVVNTTLDITGADKAIDYVKDAAKPMADAYDDASKSTREAFESDYRPGQ